MNRISCHRINISQDRFPLDIFHINYPHGVSILLIQGVEKYTVSRHIWTIVCVFISGNKFKIRTHVIPVAH